MRLRGPLTAPEPDKAAKGDYKLYAISAAAEKGWEGLCKNHKEAAQRCYEHLVVKPFTRVPGRVFPLRGKPNRGKWEYEVTGAERLYYYPDSEERIVIVLQAGGHESPP